MKFPSDPRSILNRVKQVRQLMPSSNSLFEKAVQARRSLPSTQNLRARIRRFSQAGFNDSIRQIYSNKINDLQAQCSPQTCLSHMNNLVKDISTQQPNALPMLFEVMADVLQPDHWQAFETRWYAQSVSDRLPNSVHGLDINRLTSNRRANRRANRIVALLKMPVFDSISKQNKILLAKALDAGCWSRDAFWQDDQWSNVRQLVLRDILPELDINQRKVLRINQLMRLYDQIKGLDAAKPLAKCIYESLKVIIEDESKNNLILMHPGINRADIWLDLQSRFAAADSASTILNQYAADHAKDKFAAFVRSKIGPESEVVNDLLVCNSRKGFINKLLQALPNLDMSKVDNQSQRQALISKAIALWKACRQMSPKTYRCFDREALKQTLIDTHDHIGDDEAADAIIRQYEKDFGLNQPKKHLSQPFIMRTLFDQPQEPHVRYLLGVLTDQQIEQCLWHFTRDSLRQGMPYEQFRASCIFLTQSVKHDPLIKAQLLPIITQCYEYFGQAKLSRINSFRSLQPLAQMATDLSLNHQYNARARALLVRDIEQLQSHPNTLVILQHMMDDICHFNLETVLKDKMMRCAGQNLSDEWFAVLDFVDGWLSPPSPQGATRNFLEAFQQAILASTIFAMRNLNPDMDSPENLYSLYMNYKEDFLAPCLTNDVHSILNQCYLLLRVANEIVSRDKLLPDDIRENIYLLLAQAIRSDASSANSNPLMVQCFKKMIDIDKTIVAGKNPDEIRNQYSSAAPYTDLMLNYRRNPKDSPSLLQIAVEEKHKTATEILAQSILIHDEAFDEVSTCTPLYRYQWFAYACSGEWQPNALGVALKQYLAGDSQMWDLLTANRDESYEKALRNRLPALVNQHCEQGNNGAQLLKSRRDKTLAGVLDAYMLHQYQNANIHYTVLQEKLDALKATPGNQFLKQTLDKHIGALKIVADIDRHGLSKISRKNLRQVMKVMTAGGFVSAVGYVRGVLATAHIWMTGGGIGSLVMLVGVLCTGVFYLAKKTYKKRQLKWAARQLNTPRSALHTPGNQVTNESQISSADLQRLMSEPVKKSSAQNPSNPNENHGCDSGPCSSGH